MKSAGSFLMGLIVGGLAVALYRRVEERMEEEDENHLADRMRHYMLELEERTDKLTPAAKAKPKAATKRAAK